MNTNGNLNVFLILVGAWLFFNILTSCFLGIEIALERSSIECDKNKNVDLILPDRRMACWYNEDY